MMARKGILSPGSETPAPRRQVDRPAPRGAVGALQSSLSKLQEAAVQEIDTALIHDTGVADRIGHDPEADNSLRESLRVHGQQVPVLVRPRDGQPGHFDIVYGRRRVQAMRGLGLPVKAMVRQLDDEALVLAQGQENTARRDLSFIEKASFAAQLDRLGYARDTIAAALSIDLPMVSRMLKVGHGFDMDFLVHIGSAPGIGRERWLKLAEAMKDADAREKVANRLETLAFIEGSDARFEQVLAWATGGPTPRRAKAPAPPARKIATRDGRMLGRVRRGTEGVTVTLPSKEAPGFGAWVDAHAEALLQELHDRWMNEQSEE